MAGNRNRPADPIIVNSPESACLQTFPSALQNFVEDQGSEEEYRAAWKCLRVNLKKFERTTKGEVEGLYSANEVKIFFNDYFLKETPVSDGLMEQLMKIKVMILGGTTEDLTRSEINRLLEFIADFENETSKLKGSMRLLLFKGENVTREQIDEAQGKLNQIFTNLLKKTKLLSSFYELRDLKALVHEIQPFLNKTDAFESYLQWFSFIEAVKELFMGEKVRFISLGDWESALKWTTEGFFSTLEFNYFVAKVDYTVPKQWLTAMDWVSSLFDLVSTAPLMKDKSTLPVESIDNVIDRADELKLLPKLVPVPLLKQSYRKVLAYVIEGRQSSHFDADNLLGFSKVHLKQLQAEFEVWRQSQTFLIHSFGTVKEGKTFKQLAAEAVQYESPSVITSRERSLGLQKEVLQRSWKEWKLILNSRYPLVWRDDQRLFIRAGFEDEKATYKGLTLMNAIRSFSRMILNGYSDRHSPSPFENTITKERFADFENDFRALGETLGLLDSRFSDAATRTLNEANYFTYHGDGNSLLTAWELFEEFNMLFSGGSFMANDMHAALVEKNCHIGEEDIFKKQVIKETCFQELVRKDFAKFAAHIPAMADFISKLPQADFEQFYSHILAVSRLPKSRESFVEYAEIRTAAGALQYVEALFAVYDTNKNLRLSANEVRLAFPRFKEILTKISPAKDKGAMEIFLFLLFKGKKPDPAGSFDGAMESIGFYKDLKMNNLGEIDRGHVLQVMVLIKEETASVTAATK